MRAWLRLLTAAYLLASGMALFHVEAQDLSKSGIDYQKIADSASWGWEDENASPFCGIRLAGAKYNIVMISNPNDRDSLTFKVLKGEKEVYTWLGHAYTVFRIQEDRLYYARFHPSGSGGSVVAVDLNTGKELWDSPLQAIGPVEHSAYRNLMNLDANFDVVWVWGNESNGRYLEYKDVTTGKTVGHRIFPRTQQ
jgi:PQQ enzyme repeat